MGTSLFGLPVLERVLWFSGNDGISNATFWLRKHDAEKKHDLTGSGVWRENAKTMELVSMKQVKGASLSGKPTQTWRAGRSLSSNQREQGLVAKYIQACVDLQVVNRFTALRTPGPDKSYTVRESAHAGD
jgi:hypothetical protein